MLVSPQCGPTSPDVGEGVTSGPARLKIAVCAFCSESVGVWQLKKVVGSVQVNDRHGRAGRRHPGPSRSLERLSPSKIDVSEMCP